MAGLAETFEVRQVIGTPICFSGDVVHRLSGGIPSISQAFLTEVFVPVENDWTHPVPLTAVTALMPALSSLVLLPSFVTVRLAVAGTVCGGAGAPSFTAGARDSCWHIVGSNKKATSRCQWLIKFNEMCHSSRGGPANKLFTQSMNRILKVRIDLILC